MLSYLSGIVLYVKYPMYVLSAAYFTHLVLRLALSDVGRQKVFAQKAPVVIFQSFICQWLSEPSEVSRSAAYPFVS